MNARPYALMLAFALVAVGSAISAVATTSARAAVSVFTCNQARWCTMTASGDVTPTASQLAIGNVRAGIGLAVVLSEHQQYGGEILGGNLRGLCAWSQYARDWTAARRSKDANCAHLVLNTAAFVASNGRAIWTGCDPHCFGGVPLHFDPLCGTHGHDWCYRRNCREFANFYPWMKSAHPTQPLRMTSGQWLNMRYQARYKDARTHQSFYLVEDTAAVHGTGNWIFISGAACAITAGAPGTYTATRAPSPLDAHENGSHGVLVVPRLWGHIAVGGSRFVAHQMSDRSADGRARGVAPRLLSPTGG